MVGKRQKRKSKGESSVPTANENGGGYGVFLILKDRFPALAAERQKQVYCFPPAGSIAGFCNDALTEPEI